MMKTGNSAEFACAQVKEHLRNCLTLVRQIEKGNLDPALLKRLESTNPVFSDIDFNLFGPHGGTLGSSGLA